MQDFANTIQNLLSISTLSETKMLLILVKVPNHYLCQGLKYVRKIWYGTYPFRSTVTGSKGMVVST